MILLLAAVEEETRLLRAELNGLEPLPLALACWSGRYRGRPLLLGHCGIGKAAAAAAAATLLLHARPTELWLFGCGGAYPGSNLAIGDLALATEEVFGDEGAETADGFRSLGQLRLPMRHHHGEPLFNRWPLDGKLHAWARPLLDEHATASGHLCAGGAFVTVSTCTGSASRAARLEAENVGLCENMEGAGAALACHQLAVPMLELRGISNRVGDRERETWDLAAGMAAAQQAILELLRRRGESAP